MCVFFSRPPSRLAGHLRFADTQFGKRPFNAFLWKAAVQYEVPSVRTEMLHKDRWTDTTKLMVYFRDCFLQNAPKNSSEHLYVSLTSSQCFSLHLQCVSMSDHVLRTQCRQLLAKWRQHISRLCQSTPRCVACFFFFNARLSYKRVVTGKTGNKTDNRTVLALFLGLNRILQET